MIDIKNLDFSIGNRNIIENLSFQFKDGSITHLDGRNGVGKTSLIKCILGINSFEGQIFIDEYEVSKRSINKFKHLLTFLLNPYSCYSYLTVNDNINIFNYYNHKIPTSSNIIRLFEIFELQQVSNLKVSKLSSGLRQKVELFISFLSNGKYVLLDEPFTNLDKSTSNKFYNFIIETSQRGEYTYIITSHNDVVLEEISTQKLLLQ